MEWDPIEQLSERNNIFLTKKLPHESAKRKGKISALVLENILDDESDKNDDDHYYPDSEKRNIMMMMRRRRKRRRSTLCYIRLKD